MEGHHCEIGGSGRCRGGEPIELHLLFVPEYELRGVALKRGAPGAAVTGGEQIGQQESTDCSSVSIQEISQAERFVRLIGKGFFLPTVRPCGSPNRLEVRLSLPRRPSLDALRGVNGRPEALGNLQPASSLGSPSREAVRGSVPRRKPSRD